MLCVLLQKKKKDAREPTCNFEYLNKRENQAPILPFLYAVDQEPDR